MSTGARASGPKLRNIGPKSAAWLRQVGLRSLDDLAAIGAVEAAHVHRVATELTLIASGRATMNGRVFQTGDIILLEPGEATDFRTLEPTTTVVVKMPSVKGDKYPVEAGDRS